MSEKVKVVTVFAPKGEGEGKTVELDPVDARRAVAEGRARYATEAQEKKAAKAPAAK